MKKQKKNIARKKKLFIPYHKGVVSSTENTKIKNKIQRKEKKTKKTETKIKETNIDNIFDSSTGKTDSLFIPNLNTK